MIIKNAVFLITGGSSGLGKSTAHLLLSKGAFLVILDLQQPPDRELYDNPDKVLFLPVDITSEKDVSNALDATKRKFGKLNGLINCATIYAQSKIYNAANKEIHTLQLFTKIIDVNLLGTLNVIHSALPLLLENELNSKGERGVIINTSTAGHQGHSTLLAYSASKGGVVALSHPLAIELREFGVRVVDIAPHRDVLSVAPLKFSRVVQTALENHLLNGTSLIMDEMIV